MFMHFCSLYSRGLKLHSSRSVADSSPHAVKFSKVLLMTWFFWIRYVEADKYLTVHTQQKRIKWAESQVYMSCQWRSAMTCSRASSFMSEADLRCESAFLPGGFVQMRRLRHVKKYAPIQLQSAPLQPIRSLVTWCSDPVHSWQVQPKPFILHSTWRRD